MIPEGILPSPTPLTKGRHISKSWSISDFANGDGTYNGVALLAALTGMPASEVAWTAERIKALTAQSLPRPYIHAVVTEERKSEPWNK